ncbi:unnamed protein product [Adineta ricciae]|uniref:ADP ribosyltransferase domain-containing protein n=1 Tax=Adineta ricciae TaxID=249248 RepID=A0A815D5M8_ADIRI|nr:unnamed protein product [Adineta ricciae]CAF1296286.1 unnamed protein product [Adineta ricciae]
MESWKLPKTNSSSNTEKVKQFQYINNDNDIIQRRFNFQKTQDTIFIWLKTNDTNCQDSIQQLQQIVSSVNIFDDSDECVDYITNITDNRVCLIIATSLAQYTIPCIHELSHLHYIFVFGNSTTYDNEWKKEWSKVTDVFTEVTILCKALKQLSHQCQQNDIPISFVMPGEKLNKLDPSFMYTQIMKDILLTIEYKEEHIKEYCNYCCDIYADKPQTLISIRQFEYEYNKKSPVWCYSYYDFLYPMLNRSLRVMDGDIIRQMGFFITDLHRNIEQLHKEQYAANSSNESFTVYRGQALSKPKFDQLIKAKRGLISFNNFLSTSRDCAVAQMFGESNAVIPDHVGVIFVMKIVPTQSTTPFASIHTMSNYQDEKEILFSMHTIFRINEIESIGDGNRIYKVDLSLTSDNDNDLYELTQFIKQESYLHGQNWFRLAQLLIDVGQQNAAEPISQSLLNDNFSNHEAQKISNQLGTIKLEQGKYSEALALYQEVFSNRIASFSPSYPSSTAPYTNMGQVHDEEILMIPAESLPPNLPGLADSYTNMGLVHYRMGNYASALEYHRKALMIKRKLFSPNHSSLAATYTNIGVVHREMGNYVGALECHETALAIQAESLPPNHPSMAASYTNIGVVYREMGNFTSALECHTKALAIEAESLPLNHPTLAASYTNIGVVYHDMGNYANALEYHEKALAIRTELLPSKHPSLADSYTNIGLVHREMGNYVSALEYQRKALAIKNESLPLKHPSLADSYTNIGLVHQGMGDYTSALEYHEKALAIKRESLPPSLANIADSYTNIGLIYHEMGNYTSALEYHEKALAIKNKSLSPNHLSVAASYVNIGMTYRELGNCVSALEYHEKALAIQLKLLPPNHPSLAISYVNIGLVYENMSDLLKERCYFEKGLGIWRNILPEDDSRVIAVCEKLGYVYVKEGKHGNVLIFCPDSFEVKEERKYFIKRRLRSS